MIINAVEFDVALALLSVAVGVEISASLRLNVRDAMFHYRTMCRYAEKNDTDNAFRQYYNLKEHILRGEKDAVIMITGNVLDALSDLKQQEYFNEFSPKEAKIIRQYSHKIKNIRLNIRMDGIDPDSQCGISLDKLSQELSEYISRIKDMCDAKNIDLF